MNITTVQDAVSYIPAALVHTMAYGLFFGIVVSIYRFLDRRIR